MPAMPPASAVPLLRTLRRVTAICIPPVLFLGLCPWADLTPALIVLVVYVSVPGMRTVRARSRPGLYIAGGRLNRAAAPRCSPCGQYAKPPIQQDNCRREAG